MALGSSSARTTTRSTDGTQMIIATSEKPARIGVRMAMPPITRSKASERPAAVLPLRPPQTPARRARPPFSMTAGARCCVHHYSGSEVLCPRLERCRGAAFTVIAEARWSVPIYSGGGVCVCVPICWSRKVGVAKLESHGCNRMVGVARLESHGWNRMVGVAWLESPGPGRTAPRSDR
eukprot:713692-Prymnesium_polylepis.1